MITWGQPLSPVLPSEARRFTSDSSRTEVRSERQLRKKISCGAAKRRALSKQFSVEAWLKPCPPDLASRSCTGETPAPTSQIEAGEGASSTHSYFPAPAPLLEGGKASGGFGPLSPIVLTLANSSLMLMPESVSKSAGTCAAILVMSPVILFIPDASPFPVETMVILSTLANGLASALTTSGMLVNSLSITAAWLYSWYASAFTFIALASASPFLKMISASASPC